METISSRRIAKNTLYMYARMFFVMIAALISSRIVLNVLGATDYGIYSVVGGVVTIVSFLNGALSSSTSRFLAYQLGRGDFRELCDTFSASLTLHIAVAVIAVLIGETVGLWFLLHKMVIPPERMMAALWVYQFSIVTVVFTFTQVPYSATLIAHERFSIYAYVGLYEAFATLGIAFLIKYAPADRLIFYALLLMMNKIGIQLFYRYYTSRCYKECRFRRIKDKSLYETLMGYSGWDLFGGMAMVCQGQGVSIVLNMFLGPAVNAARAIATQIEGAVNQFITNIMVSARPSVIKSFAQQDYDTMYELTFRIMKYAWMLMLAIILPLCFEMRYILRIWLVDVPNHTLYFSIIVLIGSLLQTIHSAQLMAYHAIGRIKAGNVEGGTMMMMALPISYCILRFGGRAEWCLISIVLLNFIVQLNGLRLIHKYVSFSLRSLFRSVYLPIGKVTLCAAIVPMFVYCLMPEGGVRFVCNLAFTELSIGLLVWNVGLSARERAMVMNLVKHKICVKLQH